jgi:hypothetical protein
MQLPGATADYADKVLDQVVGDATLAANLLEATLGPTQLTVAELLSWLDVTGRLVRSGAIGRSFVHAAVELSSNERAGR